MHLTLTEMFAALRENVHFHYRDDQEVLHDITFTAAPGIVATAVAARRR